MIFVLHCRHRVSRRTGEISRIGHKESRGREFFSLVPGHPLPIVLRTPTEHTGSLPPVNPTFLVPLSVCHLCPLHAVFGITDADRDQNTGASVVSFPLNQPAKFTTLNNMIFSWRNKEKVGSPSCQPSGYFPVHPQIPEIQ